MDSTRAYAGESMNARRRQLLGMDVEETDNVELTEPAEDVDDEGIPYRLL